MNSEREIAIDLLRRLLAGEREGVPMQLAMLLEKSSASCSNTDEYYLKILPPELAYLRLSEQTAESIIAAICTEVSRNPDRDLIFTISFCGADQATKTVAKILTNPPRPLSMPEYGAALALVNSYLPFRLAEDPQFLPGADLESLVHVLKGLQCVDSGKGGNEGAVNGVEREWIGTHASQLLTSLTQLGAVPGTG